MQPSGPRWLRLRDCLAGGRFLQSSSRVQSMSALHARTTEKAHQESPPEQGRVPCSIDPGAERYHRDRNLFFCRKREGTRDTAVWMQAFANLASLTFGPALHSGPGVI